MFFLKVPVQRAQRAPAEASCCHAAYLELGVHGPSCTLAQGSVAQVARGDVAFFATSSLPFTHMSDLGTSA